MFKNRSFTLAAIEMFMVGIGMFGVILYTPLFVQGVLGETATGFVENLHLKGKSAADNPPKKLLNEVAVGVFAGTFTSLSREPLHKPTGEPDR